MAFPYMGRTYSSKKHPVLEHIFNQLTANGTVGIGSNHSFTLGDISRGYAACGIPEPASISNTILDLTRKSRDICRRLPQSIVDHGYDLRKKTGPAPNGENYAGEFVYVGVGNSLSSWLIWPTAPDRELVVPNRVPIQIAEFLGRDEGALFSVIDYCDVLSLALYGEPYTVLRVQNPMKWQPNEIDGLYFTDQAGEGRLLPIEAKALSTGDDINLEQMLGAFQTIRRRRPNIGVFPIAIQMVPNGLRVAVLKEGTSHLEIDQYILVIFNPPIAAWA